MKKLIILSLILMFAYSNTNAQLKMLSNGDVGIGFSSPVHKLEVKGSISIYNPDENGDISLYFGREHTSNNYGKWGIQYVHAGEIETNSLGGLNYWVPFGSNNVFFIADNGNVLIGKNKQDNTAYKLDVTGNIGSSNLETNSTTHSIRFGIESGYSEDETNIRSNVFLGYKTGYYNTTGSYNTFNGGWAGNGNTTASYNTFNGYNAGMSNTTASYNTFSGSYSGFYNTTGIRNTFSGYASGEFNTTGSYNAYYGYVAGMGANGVNNAQCTFIGSNSYPTVARTNVTMIGYGVSNGQCTGDNQVCLGNTAITQIRAAVTTITAYSDERIKANIKENVKGLDFVLKLKPVTYNIMPKVLHQIWGTPDSLVNSIDFSEAEQMACIGFIAQDVEKAAKESGFDFPGLDVPKNDKDVYCLRYSDFIMPMVKAIQELNTNNEKQKAKIDSLQDIISEIQSLTETIKQQEEKILQLQSDINTCCNLSDKSEQKSSKNNSNNSSIEKAVLYQNTPNPFSKETQLKYFIPSDAQSAAIYIYNMQGTQLKKININSKGDANITIQGSEFKAGMYMYTLVVDGKEIDTKKMILTE
ncbi:MAG TPA: tail fiber domain-containing protein [Bacteroidales bacterium]|nr:tail fiber domain-containing protein [Bacteroidales bacterium]HPS16114.1 tail fiber domain-containing protein [Bacteroidales bacterium]